MDVKKQIDELTIEQWTFYINGYNIYLDTYSLLKRKSIKHRKYNVVKHYSRLFKRDSTIDEKDIILSDSFKKEILEEYNKKLRVIKWSEKQNN